MHRTLFSDPLFFASLFERLGRLQRHFARALTALLLLGVVGTASAGHWVASYVGGKVVFKYGTIPYALQNGKWGGGAVSNIGTTTCSGPITTTITWTKDSPTDTSPVPKRVTICEESIATATSRGTPLGPVDADNGLGHPGVYTAGTNSCNEISQGKKYRTIRTGGVSPITLTARNPYATSTQNAGDAIAGVTYSVTFPAFSVVVTVTPRVQALAWNDTKHVQDATFGVSCTVTGLPTGWSFAGVNWTSTPSTPTFEFDIPTNPNTSGHAHAPGEIDVIATAHLITNTNENIDAEGDEYCAAFGGPLTFKVIPGAGAPTTWTNDIGDPTKPYYLQHFYEHTSTLTSTMQKQQTGSVEIHGQLTGSTLTWVLPGFLYTADPNPVAGTDSLIKVTADAAGQGAVTCSIAVHWKDPTNSTPTTPVYIDATGTDDTATSKKNVGGTWQLLVNQFHAHEPKKATWVASQPYTPPLGPGQCGAGTNYTITLTDTDSGAMPDVWFNERYVPTDPNISPPFKSNNMMGTFWTSIKPDGKLNDLDYIYYVWPAPPPAWQSYTFTHDYWAASKSGVPGLTEGFKVGTAVITLTPATGSSPASVSQTASP